MKLYNSLSQTIETFTPHDKANVTMYVCGITPYDTTHLGHAFTYTAFDLLQRFLKYEGLKVTYVQNVTDIDDDILKRANELKQNWKELGTFWTNKFLTDLKILDIEMPTLYVKATETIPTIVEFVQILEQKGFAYANNGNVYFDLKKDPEYGKLSRYSREAMIKLSKERGGNPEDPFKKDPLDFILWQKSTEDEPFWESPWSKGRPGWHIECSAMIYKYLDKNIDIHGGGSDLIYPHHESEIAQSESFTGIKPFAKYWMHTGAVGYKGKKMSKSLGNLVMLEELLKTYTPDTIRYLLLSHHYREPWEFKEEQLLKADQKISLWKKSLQKPVSKKSDNNLLKEFTAALRNDLNSPAALDVLDRTFEKNDTKMQKTMSAILGFNF